MKYVNELLEEMEKEESSLKENLLADVKRHRKKLIVLCQELSVPVYEVSSGSGWPSRA